MKVKVITLTCKQCGHKWTPRIADVKICPHCKNGRWNANKEAVNEKNKRRNQPNQKTGGTKRRAANIKK